MSVVESLHQARKARLRRFAARAVPEQSQKPPAAARLHVARQDRFPRYRRDEDYERAWAFEIMGLAGSSPAPVKLRVEDIQRAVACHFGVSRNDLMSACRVGKVALPRHVAMYLARELTTRSYPEIGRCFGGRDHSTVLHAVSRIAGQIAHDAELAASVDRLRDLLQTREIWL